MTETIFIFLFHSVNIYLASTMGIRHRESGVFFLACFNAKSLYVVLMGLKFVTIGTKGKSQSELASSCIESIGTAFDSNENLNSVLLINQGNNLVCLAWPFLFLHKNCKWFWKNSLFVS